MAIGAQQLKDLVTKELFPFGHQRFHWNKGTVGAPRLVDGIELLNLRGDWAISLFRNVNNIENDVEIAIAPGRIAPDGMAGAMLAWLESLRGELDHREHDPHHGRYQKDVFRIGLKRADLEVFLRRFMAEVLKRASQSPWAVTASQAEVATGEREVPEPLQPSLEDLRARSIAHMVAMACAARDQSGMEKTGLIKDKQMHFSPDELRAHVDKLWTSEHCALSGLKLDMTGGDPELSPSLDRIDSNKHYEPGNLQVVARFINRWKSDDEQGNFVRLLKLVRSAPSNG